GRGRTRSAAARVAAAAELARGGPGGKANAPPPRWSLTRVGGTRAGSWRALPWGTPFGCAGLDGAPRTTAERAGARVRRGQPRRERAPAPSLADPAGRRRRPARRCGRGRDRRTRAASA